jgi:hypothetical protein
LPPTKENTVVAKQVFVPLTLAGLVIAVAPAVAQAQQSIDELPSGLREAVVEATYGVVQDGQACSASNPAQGMRSAFTAQGIQVSGDSETRGSWTLSFSLEAWGRPGSMQVPAPAEPTVQGRRVEYRRGELIEWYVNDPQGLEQGFTLNESPAGAGSLEIVLGTGDGFTVEIGPGGRDALFRDRATGSVLHYSGLRAWDAAGCQLDAALAAEGENLSIRVLEDEAVYPVYIDPWIVTEEAKLEVSDPASGDAFGISVALSGDTALIGASGDDHTGLNSAGSAYVFVRSGTTWAEQQKLTASDAASVDLFGRSVSISGDTAVIGATHDDHAGGTDAGSAYVFVRSGSSWTEQAKLTASDAAFDDQFGNSASISGDTAVVGVQRDDHIPGGEDAGSVYVFVRSGTSWTEQAKLTASDEYASDYFGGSVGLSGDTAVIGACGDAASNEGSAYVFVRSGTSWTEQARLSASDGETSDHFGNSVSFSGDTTVVGAEYDDYAGGWDAGSAYVFVRNGTSWTEQAKLTASDAEPFDRFGTSVDVSGDTAVIGAPFGDYDGGPTAGCFYLFTRSGTGWTEQAKAFATDTETGDQFGGAVGLAGDTTVVGARGGSTNTGSAYVFRLFPPPVSYCTAGTSASGCQALISASGTASATASSGFTLSASTVEGQKDGLFYFGTNGKQSNPWGNGTSYQCVVPPVVRTRNFAGTGTIGLCDGSFVHDLNALWCPSCPKPAKNPGAGTIVQAQLWYRDPLSTSNQTTSLSDAIEFVVGL